MSKKFFFLNFDLIKKIENIDTSKLSKLDSSLRIGACVSKPSKFIGIGLNFKDHAEEQNLPIPKEPIIFSKFTSCITGPNDPIIVPKGSNHTDWEVELGFVIGKKAINVSVESALDHVLGFFLVNDVSERDFQKNKGLTWDKGKGFDTFGPIGPYIVTKDELPNFQKLNMFLDVDGKRMQTGNTEQMIFDIKTLVSLAIKNKKGRKITVEVDNLKQLNQIIGLKFNTILFDNMNIKTLKAGVKVAKKYYETEASGNIDLKSVKKIAATGVDRISIGGITHSAPAVDFKLEI